MRKILISWSVISAVIGSIQAQQSIVGVQNSPRKGIVNSLMNPAEINNLSKKIEVNIFSIQAGLSNDVLTFSDVIEGADLVEKAFDTFGGPVNLRTDVSLIGPSIGFSVRKWSFGIATQAFFKADFVDLDSDLARSLFEENDVNQPAAATYSLPHLRSMNPTVQTGTMQTSTTLNSPYNQRISGSGWMEIDFLMGREILTIGPHAFSGGANIRLLIPNTYVNLGLSEIRGELVDDGDQIYLTNSQGELNITYSDPYFDEDFAFNTSDRLNFSTIGGLAVDLGGNYQWKKEGKPSFLNAGLAVRNLGGMTFSGSGQVNNSYTMNIPQNQRFRVDNLEGNLDEIEDQLIESGYFTINKSTENLRVNLPTLVSAYAELRPAKAFQVSLFVQQRMSDENSNLMLTSQNIVALTPRLILGKFELYSPWAHYQVAGFTGGLGIQIGGFFLGSNSLLTGSLANSMQADVHMGFSFGVGKK